VTVLSLSISLLVRCYPLVTLLIHGTNFQVLDHQMLAKPHVQVDKSNPVSEAVEIVVCTLYETKLMLAM
jgi:hypothetical protein